MAVVDMISKLKQVHPESVIIYKAGLFYNTYGKDAYIISGMFGYSLKSVSNTVTSGFGENALNKVRNKLEENKVNYIFIDPRNNYDVNDEFDNRNLNRYEETLQKCYKEVKFKNSIQEITDRLKMMVEKDNFKEIIRKVEDVLDEN